MEISYDELAGRLDDTALTILDVRSGSEFAGETGYGCCGRQGNIPGARHLDVQELASCGSVDEVRELVAVPAGSEVAAYCHSGGRSAWAVEILLGAGYVARNYVGSWHEWSHTVPASAD